MVENIITSCFCVAAAVDATLNYSWLGGWPNIFIYITKISSNPDLCYQTGHFKCQNIETLKGNY